MTEKKLRHANGLVNFIMPAAGKDFVKSQMPKEEAENILSKAKKVEDSTKFDGFDICVDDFYYFPIQKREIKKTEI